MEKENNTAVSENTNESDTKEMPETEGGYKKEQIKEIFWQIYWVQPEKFELAYNVYENEKKFIAQKGEKGIGICTAVECEKMF